MASGTYANPCSCSAVDACAAVSADVRPTAGSWGRPGGLRGAYVRQQHVWLT